MNLRRMLIKLYKMKKLNKEEWYIYMIRGRNDAIYTGITKNVQERLRKHNAGVGGKYTRSFRPFELECYFGPSSHSHALQAEYYLKTISKKWNFILENYMIREAKEALFFLHPEKLFGKHWNLNFTFQLSVVFLIRLI